VTGLVALVYGSRCAARDHPAVKEEAGRHS
jgi:hypothetical protein